MRHNRLRASRFLERHFGIVVAVGLVAGLSFMAMLGFTP